MGCGVRVGVRLVLTARHVLGARSRDGSWPTLPETVDLVFPGGGVPVTAAPVAPVGDADILLLDLGQYPPEGVAGPVGLWAPRRPPVRVSLFGYPAADRTDRGVWRDFTVSGPTADGMVHLAWDEQVGSWTGQSGAPVIDQDTGLIVGVLAEGSDKLRLDRYVPVHTAEPGLRLPWVFAGPDARAHVTARATGQRSRARGGDLFKGRTTALDTIASWVGAVESPGCVLVVTGQPGAGKSAVLGRAALAAERDHPGSGVVVHARDLTHPQFLDSIAATAGVATPDGPGDLLTALDTDPADPVVRVMVDALDEAATEAERNAIANTLTELAVLPRLRVVVATRPLNAGDRHTPGTLLARLDAAHPDAGNVVDLDQAPYADPRAVADFAVALLTQDDATHPGPPGRAWTAYRADPELTRRLAGVVAERAGGNFLVAALTAVPLSKDPQVVDPDAPGFDPATLPTSVGEALEKYLDHLPVTERVRTKGLLTALAHAKGTGVTDRSWLTFTAALGYPATQADLDTLRAGAAADYLLQTTPTTGGRITRLFHQALIDQLRPVGRARAEDRAILRALLDEVRSAGGWAHAEAYALTYAAAHALDAGTLSALLDDTDFCIHADLTALAAAVASTPPAARTQAAWAILTTAVRAAGYVPTDLTSSWSRTATSGLGALEPPARARLLSLAAAHLGVPELVASFSHRAGPGLAPVWAHRLTPAHFVLRGHRGRVKAVTIGRLGNRDVIVTGGSDGTVRIWDSTGTSVRGPLRGHTDHVFSVAVGRLDGRVIIASCGLDKTVRLWDEWGEPIGQPLHGHTQPVRSVAIGSLGGRDVIASAGDDGKIRMWDSHCDPLGDPWRADPTFVDSVAIAKVNGRDVIATAGRSGVHFWDENGRSLNELLTPFRRPRRLVAGNLNGRSAIAVSDGIRSVALMTERAPLMVAPAGTDSSQSLTEIVAIGELAGRSVLALASPMGVVQLFDADGNPVTEQFVLPRFTQVRAAAIGRLDGRDVVAVAAGEDGSVWLWDEPGQIIGSARTGNSTEIDGLAVIERAESARIATFTSDGTIAVWDEEGRPVGRHRVIGSMSSIGASWDGRDALIVAGIAAGSLYLFDGQGRPISGPWAGHSWTVNSVAIGRLGNRDVVVSGSNDGTALIRDTQMNPLGAPLIDADDDRVFAVAIGQLGARDVVAAVTYGRLRLWDADRRLVGDYPTEPVGTITAVCIGRLGERDVLAAADNYGRVWLLDERGELIVEPLQAHAAPVTGIAIGKIADGRSFLATVGEEATLRLWGARGEPIGGTIPLLRPARGVAIIRAGVVTASGNALVLLR